MAYDKIIDSTKLNSDLTSVANAIRAKTGETAKLSFPSGMNTAIGTLVAPKGTLNITENGEKTVSAYEKVNVNIPFVSFYTGTADPSSSLGQNNDIYLKTT